MRFIINRASFKTQKELDGNNFLVAYDVPIAKTGLQQYTRGEIGADGDPDEMVNVYRDPHTFQDSELVKSFDGIPIVYQHPKNGQVNYENFKDYVVGTVSGVYYKNGSLYAKKLTIIDKDAIENVLSKNTNELSIGFRGVVNQKKGKYNGIKYEFEEEVIHANHLALCEQGKAGSFYAINSRQKKGKQHMDVKNALPTELTPDIHHLIETAVHKKLKEVKPHNFGDSKELDEEDCFGNESEEEAEEHESEGEKKHLKKKKRDKEHEREGEEKHLEDASNPELEASEHRDKDIVNALKRQVRTLHDLVNDRDREIRKLDKRCINLENGLIEAREYVKNMGAELRTRKVTHSLAGPDSILSPSHPRQVNLSNSITSSFLMK